MMVKAKKGKSAFTDKEINARTKQSKWSRDHIKKYPMNWFKLKWKINAFPIIILLFYVGILVILLLNITRALFVS